MVLPSHDHAIGLKILKRYNTFCKNHKLYEDKIIVDEKIQERMFAIDEAIEKFR